MLGNLLMVF